MKFMKIPSFHILERINDSMGRVTHITAYVEEDTLKLVLVCLIVGFLSASCVVLFMILLRRTILIKEVRVRKQLVEKYETFLSESMTYFYENEKIFDKKVFAVTLDKNDQMQTFNRKTLLEQILLMKKHVGGEEAQMLHGLYEKLGFYRASLRKLKSWYWHRRLEGMQELILMECASIEKLFHKMTRDRHQFVRIEAIRALILRGNDWQPSLIRYSYPLSMWEQFQICDALSRRQNIQLPDFTPLLKSLNPTVVLFALRMIKHFHSMEAVPQVEPFLKSENPTVAKAAEDVMTQFGFDFEILESDILETHTPKIDMEKDDSLQSLIDLESLEMELSTIVFNNFPIKNYNKRQYENKFQLAEIDILEDFLQNF